MEKKKFIKNLVNWLSDGSGLPLRISEDQRVMFRYVTEEVITTKAEGDLLEKPNALVVIGSVRNIPRYDIPTFIFEHLGSVSEISSEDVEESIIYDDTARNPVEAARNASEFLRAEFGVPARGERPKFLVVAEYPLLAALFLGTLTWIDFYFRPSRVNIQDASGKEVDRLFAAYLAVMASVRSGEGLSLSIEKLLSRPLMADAIPYIREHCGYLTPELLEKAGSTTAMLAEEIKKRQECL